MLNAAGSSPALRYFDFLVTVFDQSRKKKESERRAKIGTSPFFLRFGSTESRWFSFQWDGNESEQQIDGTARKLTHPRVPLFSSAGSRPLVLWRWGSKTTCCVMAQVHKKEGEETALRSSCHTQVERSASSGSGTVRH